MGSVNRGQGLKGAVERVTDSANDLPIDLGRSRSIRIGDLFAERLADLGVETAFGIVGGGIAPMSHALLHSRIRVVHTRHEAGAAFAATEASLASGRPTVVFTTTGPGITNALTGLFVARREGATVILVSGATAAPVRDRWVLQESAPHAMLGGMYSSGPLFHHAMLLEHGEQLGTVLARLARGVRRPQGFVAHVGIPTPLQSQEIERPPRAPQAFELRTDRPLDLADVTRVAELLQGRRVAIWVGFGARAASRLVRMLAERLGAPVMASPRAKGVFDEGHPLYLGVTGFGGHAEVSAALGRYRPEHVLVLGTRMGELSSGWDRALVPSESFIHVDVDPDVPGLAFPDVPTLGIAAELRVFLDALLERLPASSVSAMVWPAVEGWDRPSALTPRRLGPVRPQVLMDKLQQVVVDGSEAMVFADAGNSFAWTIHRLCFERPGRFRVNMGWGSMGHGGTGPLGAVLHHADKAVSVLGDGAMLMNCEVSTAVQYGLAVVWVVLNDSQYGMVEHGMRAAGYQPVQTTIPRTDFAVMARSMGAVGIRVESEEMLEEALERAMEARGPVVVDVVIDPDVSAPVVSRLNQLAQQGVVAEGGRGEVEA